MTEKVEPALQPASDRETLRTSHFFILAAIVAATAALFISRNQPPSHLVLGTLGILAAALAALGLHRTILPLTARGEVHRTELIEGRTRAALEREKMLVLRSIKELEFDRAMGKISDPDFHEMAGRLRARAISLMKQLERGPVRYQEIIEQELEARLQESRRRRMPADSVMACPACGESNDSDARFCKACGVRIQ